MVWLVTSGYYVVVIGAFKTALSVYFKCEGDADGKITFCLGGFALVSSFVGELISFFFLLHQSSINKNILESVA